MHLNINYNNIVTNEAQLQQFEQSEHILKYDFDLAVGIRGI